MQTELKEPTRCPAPECGAYHGHHPLCPHLSEAEARAALKAYYNAFLRDSDSWRESRIRLKNLITLWQGKFRIVTHENNQLRKALYAKQNLPNDPKSSPIQPGLPPTESALEQNTA